MSLGVDVKEPVPKPGFSVIQGVRRPDALSRQLSIRVFITLHNLDIYYFIKVVGSELKLAEF